MTACKIGEFAISKAGHDKNEIFVIYNVVGEYVYLVDGKNRTINNPKKKKLMHLQPVHVIAKELQSKMESDKILQDEDIKRAIKCYRQRKEI